MDDDTAPLTQDRLDLVEATFGRDLLAFALNTRGEDLTVEHLQSDAPRLQSLSFLVDHLLALRREAFERDAPLDLLAQGLGITARADRNFIVEERRRFGGDPPLLEGEDPIVQALSPFVAPTYPYLLIHEHLRADAGQSHTPRIPSLFAPDAAWTPLQEAIAADEVLGPLIGDVVPPTSAFTDPQSAADRDVWVDDSMGMGGTIQGLSIPSVLLTTAYVLSRLRDLRSQAALSTHAAEAVDLVRRAFGKAGARMPVFVAVEGLSLPADRTITLPWGVVRPSPARHANLVAPYGSIVDPTFGRAGFALRAAETPGVVIELTAPVKYHLGTPPDMTDFEGWRRRRRGGRADFVLQSVRHDLDLCALTVLMALGHEEAPVFDVAWSGLISPLRLTGVGGRPMAMAPQRELTDTDITTIEEYGRLLDEHRSDSTRIARRRTVSAAFERKNPEDRFIDAVIGWEALFGAGSELTFRITASMARLLEAEPTLRRQRQKELMELYRLRGNVVHGGSKWDANTAAKHAEDAITHLVASWRALHDDRPDLLADPQRSTTLLLEG